MLTFSWDINVTTIGVAIASVVGFYLVVTRLYDQVKAMALQFAQIAKAMIEIKAQRDDDLRGYGETAAALRQKIGDVEIETNKKGAALELWCTQKFASVELWSRDQFVRRDSFAEIIRSGSDEHKAWRAAFDERMNRIENKIDRLGPAKTHA